VVSIPSSPPRVGPVSLGASLSHATLEIPASAIQALKPTEVGQFNGMNFILGKATVDKTGGRSEDITVIAIATKQGHPGRYLVVPPNSTPEAVLSLLRSPNPNVT
jgi:hypothetical protein